MRQMVSYQHWSDPREPEEKKIETKKGFYKNHTES